MYLQKQLSKKIGDKEYVKYVIVVPPKLIDKLGWKGGEELEAKVKDKKLVMNLGHSHSVEIVVPEGITVQVVKKPVIEQLGVTQLVLGGIDNQQIGEFAASIRKIRPHEPYKGAGIRDVGEYVRRKAGKKAA